MQSGKTKSSYSAYVEDEMIKKIEESDYSQSEAVRQALKQWIPENIEN